MCPRPLGCQNGSVLQISWQKLTTKNELFALAGTGEAIYLSHKQNLIWWITDAMKGEVNRLGGGRWGLTQERKSWEGSCCVSPHRCLSWRESSQRSTSPDRDVMSFPWRSLFLSQIRVTGSPFCAAVCSYSSVFTRLCLGFLYHLYNTSNIHKIGQKFTYIHIWHAILFSNLYLFIKFCLLLFFPPGGNGWKIAELRF